MGLGKPHLHLAPFPFTRSTLRPALPPPLRHCRPPPPPLRSTWTPSPTCKTCYRKWGRICFLSTTRKQPDNILWFERLRHVCLVVCDRDRQRPCFVDAGSRHMWDFRCINPKQFQGNNKSCLQMLEWSPLEQLQTDLEMTSPLRCCCRHGGRFQRDTHLRSNGPQSKTQVHEKSNENLLRCFKFSICLCAQLLQAVDENLWWTRGHSYQTCCHKHTHNRFRRPACALL